MSQIFYMNLTYVSLLLNPLDVYHKFI